MYWFTSKNKISLFILFTLLCPSFIFAQSNDVCSKVGYTILTINGIFTNDNEAKNNSDKFKYILGDEKFEGEPVYVDYVLNPSHGKGVIDIADVLAQKIIENVTIFDHDLVDVINDASKKVKTQKVLLVAHSQGNFYANNIYSSVTGIGKVPGQSMGVYSVASPASHVAGTAGRYLTSSTDTVINKVRKFGIFDVLPANDTIDISANPSSNGHSFVDVYLKYRAEKIVDDIKYSLGTLLSTNIQPTDQPCIPAPDITILHKAVSGVLAFTDHPYEVSKTGAIYAFNGLSYMGNKVLDGVTSTASAISSFTLSLFGKENDLAKNNTASVVDSVEEPLDTKENTEPDEAVIPDKKINEMPDPYDSYKESEVIVPPLNINESKIETETKKEETIEVPVVANTYGFSSYPPQARPPVENSTPAPAPTPDTTPPVITISGNSSIYITKNSTYTDAGATASDAVDGNVSVSTSGSVDTSTNGTYAITYTATDAANNTVTATRSVKVSTYVYIPKYHFGNDNGDGNDWQAWYFNGSEIYGWNDDYVNHYLHQTFKVQQVAGAWCTQCLQKGIFNHNPEQGFESSDVVLSLLNTDDNVQTNNTGLLYNVDMQWDATGYTYTFIQDNDSSTHATGHNNVSNIDANTYVGWDDSFNNFQTFPSGNWMGLIYPSTSYLWSHDYTGGSSMILPPKAIYVP